MQDTARVSTQITGNAPSRARVDPSRNAWRWGFTPQAEIWNGRLAMIGFLAATLIQLFSDQGLLHFWSVL
jgi:hypothetical protein